MSNRKDVIAALRGPIHVAIYTTPTDDIGDLLTVEDYKDAVQSGGFIDYDGFGHPVKDGLADENIRIYPSELGRLPEDATHIMWYNR